MEPLSSILHSPYGVDRSSYSYYVITDESSLLDFYCIFRIFSFLFAFFVPLLFRLLSLRSLLDSIFLNDF